MKNMYGYAGTILRVDLSSRKITRMPTADYADMFIGGRGIAAKIYWDEVGPEVDALSPENALLLVTGPVTGFRGIGTSRFQICGTTPSFLRQ